MVVLLRFKLTPHRHRATSPEARAVELSVAPTLANDRPVVRLAASCAPRRRSFNEDAKTFAIRGNRTGILRAGSGAAGVRTGVRLRAAGDLLAGQDEVARVTPQVRPRGGAVVRRVRRLSALRRDRRGLYRVAERHAPRVCRPRRARRRPRAVRETDRYEQP